MSDQNLQSDSLFVSIEGSGEYEIVFQMPDKNKVVEEPWFLYDVLNADEELVENETFFPNKNMFDNPFATLSISIESWSQTAGIKFFDSLGNLVSVADPDNNPATDFYLVRD